ncbi:cornifelin [Psammomys obesus]|uniref:cornifelin n=1 Tax=Psammomys obesus TaxID=48139 RepID=UPI0024531EFC|nr:cornifelin [Psammomys obesus]
MGGAAALPRVGGRWPAQAARQREGRPGWRGPGGPAAAADPLAPATAMSYPVTSQPQCASSCYQTQLSDWHTGLTDCCNDMPVCLCGTFAPLCLACRISDDFGECCCAPYLPGGLHSLRTGMRERYHIQGSVGHDWAALTFCLPCALCQMARELKIRE